MANLVRFAVSLDRKLFNKFEEYWKSKGYISRSEAIRDLIRDALIEDIREKNKIVFGSITLIYNHHEKGLGDLLTDIQHKYLHTIISSMHVHIDAHHCLEVIAVKGRYSEVKELSDKLLTVKGVKHGKLVITAITP